MARLRLQDSEPNARCQPHGLTQVLKASVPEIREAVVTTPSLLGYSLDSRICPRATRLLERGVNPTFSEHR